MVSYEDVDIPVNPNLPPWILSPKEEKLVTDRWQKVSQEKCDALIKKYIECSNASANPLKGIKNCKGINNEVKECLDQYKTLKYYDEQRDLYIKEKIEKKKMIDEYIKNRDAKK